MSRIRFYLIGFSALAFFDTLTQVSLKFAAQHTGPLVFDPVWVRAALMAPGVYGAIAGYLGAFVTWMKLLEHAPVGPAFAASHIDVVTVLLISIPLFGERLGAPQMAGALLIVAGIVVLAVSESDSTPDRASSLASSPASGAS